jgi:hypothetical protein
MLLVAGAGLRPAAIVASWSRVSVREVRITKMPSCSNCACASDLASRRVARITFPSRTTSSHSSPTALLLAQSAS